MYGASDATFLVLCGHPLDQTVINALESAAEALGHTTGCAVLSLDELDRDGTELVDFIYRADPWCVIPIDDASITRLCDAFPEETRKFAGDCPVKVGAGYLLVAVPGFAKCLDNRSLKRLCWERLKAARHPGNPLG